MYGLEASDLWVGFDYKGTHYQIVGVFTERNRKNRVEVLNTRTAKHGAFPVEVVRVALGRPADKFGFLERCR
jgi:hypothetical protein